MRGSGAASEVRQFAVVEAHALWQHDAEAIEERGLRGIRLGDTAQANLAMRRGRQHDVVGLDARQFFEDGTRRVSDPARHFHITKARKHTRMWACKQHHGV